MINNSLRANLRGVSPVIAVILMVAITVVMSGLLWAMLQTNTAEPKAINISALQKDKGESYKFTLSAVSRNNLYIQDLQFRVIDSEGVLVYQIRSSDINPPVFSNGLSEVYAMTINNTVLDSTTSNPVTSNSRFENYINCCIAYVDTDSDGKVNEGDTVYLYKDYNNDGINDILPIYKIQFFIEGELALETKV